MSELLTLEYSVTSEEEQASLKRLIRDVPDFPEEGIIFRDVTPLLKNPKALHFASRMMTPWRAPYEVVVAVEARGFMFATGSCLAGWLKPLVLVRKAGKLPGPCYQQKYDLEYGEGKLLEMQVGDIEPGQRVLLMDDLLATGGTTIAAAKLVEQAGGIVAGVSVLMELEYCGGREVLTEAGYHVHSVIRYQE